jgi:EAL domain-containing protein (putative c-di-GMP-specific phosphodiesterase class I)
MNRLLRTAGSSGQEPMLLDYVQRLDRFRKDRRAVHVHFSRLRPHHRGEHQMRIAPTTFDRLKRKYESSLFRLVNGDAVLIVRGASAAELEAVVGQLRGLFSDDPAVNTPDGEADAFITLYNLERDYDRLLAACQAFEEARRNNAITQAAKPEAVSAPIGPDDLSKLKRAIANADLAMVMHRQPVVTSLPDRAPQPLFHELYISTADLSRIVTPGVNLTADRWLFQHLTEALDQRMLSLLMRRRDPALTRDFSLNLNVSTVLSPEFMQFDREIAPVAQGRMIIELQQIDIFADPGRYFFAREFLRDRGYKLCLDGVKHLALPLIDREQLGVDFVKFEWGYGLVDDHDGPRGAGLREAAARIGRERLILCRCDSPEALRVGRAMGVTMYQGRYFDGLLREATEPQSAA